MQTIFLILVLTALVGSASSTELRIADRGCSQWLLQSVPAASLVKRASLLEIDQIYKSNSYIDACLPKEWEKLKAELRTSDEVWFYQRPLSDGGVVVITDGVPGKGIVIWAH